jgi:acyl-CoA thioester hydrolase
VTDEFRHRTRIDVRFRDVDAFGHVNNAVFLSYAEQARIRYLTAALGHPITLTDVEELPLILARLEVDYRAPIFFGETVEVGTRIDWVGDKSFAMSHRLTAGDDAHRVADVASVLVSYDYAAARSMRVPEAWRRGFEAAEGHSLEREAQAKTQGVA